MKIRFQCITCFINECKDAPRGTQYISKVPYLFLPVHDSNIYQFKCPEGHENKIIIQEPKYQTLFMIAENAIIDCYYREAVSSFTTSMERAFEEYYSFAFFKKDFNQKLIESSWKLIAKQSERQFGSFVALWCLLNNETPQILSTGDVRLRNKTIHEGYIPSRKEAIEYGESIIKVIAPIYKTVKNDAEYRAYRKNKFDITHKKEGEGIANYDLMTGIKKFCDSNYPFQKWLNDLEFLKTHGAL